MSCHDLPVVRLNEQKGATDILIYVAGYMDEAMNECNDSKRRASDKMESV